MPLQSPPAPLWREVTARPREKNCAPTKLLFSLHGKAYSNHNLPARPIQLTFIYFILYWWRYGGGVMEFDVDGWGMRDDTDIGGFDDTDIRGFDAVIT
eukprot:scaffold122848_cov31-Cyclotella_meneghiniana.AAC.1